MQETISWYLKEARTLWLCMAEYKSPLNNEDSMKIADWWECHATPHTLLRTTTMTTHSTRFSPASRLERKSARTDEVARSAHPRLPSIGPVYRSCTACRCCFPVYDPILICVSLFDFCENHYIQVNRGENCKAIFVSPALFYLEPTSLLLSPLAS